MKPKIQLEKSYFEELIAILNQNLPPASKVWMFGSRATGMAKTYSDIDLAIALKNDSITLELQASLSDAFTASSLPYKVDIVDLNQINHSFKNHIKKDLKQII